MEEKLDLITKLQEIYGRIPVGTTEILNMIAHPQVIEFTKRYISAKDFSSRCTNYQAPWSCIREAEAKYENIKYGWLGAGAGYSEWWCENCRKKVTES